MLCVSLLRHWRAATLIWATSIDLCAHDSERPKLSLPRLTNWPASSTICSPPALPMMKLSSPENSKNRTCAFTNAYANKPNSSDFNSFPSPHENLVHEERRSPRRPQSKDLLKRNYFSA